jgi:hypothetical protein
MRAKPIYYELQSDPNDRYYEQDYFDDNGDLYIRLTLHRTTSYFTVDFLT